MTDDIDGSTFSVGVHDFGPVATAQVALRPLTVFVGPNNSGKSYMAMLLYALMRSFPASGFRTGPPGRVFFPILYESRKRLPSGRGKVLENWLRRMGEQHTSKVGQLPVTVKDSVSRRFRASARPLTTHLAQEVARCFGVGVPGLTRKDSQPTCFRLSIEPSHRRWRYEASCSSEKLHGELSSIDIDATPLEFGTYSEILRVSGRYRPPVFGDLYAGFVGAVTEQIFGPLPQAAYYFPAARSGILLGHKIVASVLVSRSPLAGIEPLAIPQFSGVVTDFISSILMLDRTKQGPLAGLASYLEQEVTAGEIVIDSRKLEFPEILYSPAVGRLPLYRSSSMVAELAALVLFLKYVIRPNHLLIIEEPESHLHPRNQLRLAVVIARLVRSGVRILITTHSDYFLGQLSNLLRLSRLSPDERKSLGYAEEDSLQPDQVSAYLFRPSPGLKGTVVEPIRVSADEGIAEEEFISVAQALYDETVRFEREVSGSEPD